MAKQEADREDLMREAIAFIQRIEFAISDSQERVIAGYRKSGALSLYFGADPVYQFDSEGRLRRAFVGGYLYRTQGGTLARLNRIRTKTETILQRTDLSQVQLKIFLDQLYNSLHILSKAISSNQMSILQQVPADVDIISALVDSLHRLLKNEIQLAPSIKGKN